MKIKEVIYNIPEMTEEKLLEIIDANKFLIKKSSKKSKSNI